MSEHTKGPLEYSSAGHGTKNGIVTDEYFIRRPDGVAVAADVVDPETGTPSEANARRLVACWNALQHISTERLETGEALHLGQQIADLKRQLDELISAFEEVLRISDREHDAWGRARAAIAAAKGEPLPRYTSITKGGSYERLGAIRGAGALKGLSGIAYRDGATGNLFVREPECFAARMKLIPDPADAVDGDAQ